MIRGETRKIEKATPINANVRASIHNRFDIEVVDARTGEVKNKAVGYNVITNQLWNRLLTPETYFNYVFYGSGSGTPSASDTSLFHYVGYLSATGDAALSLDRTNGVYSRTKKHVLAENVAVGVGITEVGIAYGTGTSNLCTHAMLQDMNGNPITINKTATDIINIYATVYVHFSASGWDGGSIFVAYSNIMVWLTGASKSTYTAIPGFAAPIVGAGRGCYAENFYNSSLPYGSGSYKTNAITYNRQDKKVTFAMGRLGASGFNYGGIASIFLFGGGTGSYETMQLEDSSFQLMVGGSWYRGTSIVGEPIGTGDGETVDFKTAFPFVTEATIKINGAVETSVTVDLNMPPKAHFVSPSSEEWSYGFELNSIDSAGMSWFSKLPTANRFSELGPIEYYENPHYSKVGINALRGTSGVVVYATNNLNSWHQVAVLNGSTSSSVAVPTEYQNCRYWKFEHTGMFWAMVKADIPEYNIHFDTPPAVGAVITADYYTKTIAKDENHVFDLTVTIQLGEYSEV